VTYHGYYFKILKGQGPNAAGGARDYLQRGLMIGGFALIVWPSEYGSSGIKTFLVNQDDIIYQKDLEPGTGKVAQAITNFNPDKTWRVAKVDCLLLRIPRCSYAAEPQVVGPRADLALAACADHVSRTILVRAEERSPTLDLLLLPGLQWIVGAIRAQRIAGNAARLG
jgi:hypothetical protein